VPRTELLAFCFIVGAFYSFSYAGVAPLSGFEGVDPVVAYETVLAMAESVRAGAVQRSAVQCSVSQRHGLANTAEACVLLELMF
jgi:hypothetical protein